MKKLPLVAALCAASLCTVASAQSSVTIYGKLYPYLVSEKGSSPTAPGTAVSTLSGSLSATPGVVAIKGMQAGNSRIGFRGTEDLGGGLKVFFQMESVVAVDNGVGGAGAGGAFWNRDTFVGMRGGFGEVRLGEMDTIFKNYGDVISFMGVSSGTPMSSSNMLRKPGFGTSNNARFHERRANSIAWESVEFNGIQVGAMVSTNEASVTANTGLGAAKRVVFFDTLLSKLSGPEVEAVLAHELGHFKHRHITKRIGVMFAMSLAGFALLGWLAQQPAFYVGLGVMPNLEAPNDALALMLFLLVGPVFGFFVTPLASHFSSRDEFQADAYARAQASGADLSSALLKLHEDNAGTLTPDPVYARFYYSHPPAAERLAALAS